MPDYLPIARFPLPDDLEPEGTICVKVTIPDDPQYLGTLIGLIDLLKWSKNFARDETGIGAATVSRTWQRALESQPVESEGCDMPDFRINPETCLLEVNCSDDPEVENWQPVFTSEYDPTTDAPVSEPYPEPPPPGEDNACLAAANAAAFLEWGAGNFADNVGNGGILGVVAAGLAAILNSVVTVTTSQLWVGLGTYFGLFNALTILDDYEAMDWDEVKNVLVCHYTETGKMEPLEFGYLLDDFQNLAAGTGNQIWLLLTMVASLMGVVGFAYAAKWAGIDSADCDTCGVTTHYWDFTTDNTDWQPQTDYTGLEGTDLSEWVSSVGWREVRITNAPLGMTNYPMNRIVLEFPEPTTLYRVTNNFYFFHNPNGWVRQYAINGVLGGVTTTLLTFGLTLNLDNTQEWTGETIVDRIEIVAEGYSILDIEYRNVEIEFQGDDPF